MSDDTQKPAEEVVNNADKEIIEKAIAEKTEAEKPELIEAEKTVINLDNTVEKAVQDAVNEGAPVVEDVPVEEANAQVIEKPVVKEPVAEEPILPKTYYCSSCKSNLPGSIVKKIPLDYIQNPKDGSVKPGKVRFTLLCGKCDGFLRIYDPNYGKALDKAFPKKTQ